MGPDIVSCGSLLRNTKTYLDVFNFSLLGVENFETEFDFVTEREDASVQVVQHSGGLLRPRHEQLQSLAVYNGFSSSRKTLPVLQREASGDEGNSHLKGTKDRK